VSIRVEGVLGGITKKTRKSRSVSPFLYYGCIKVLEEGSDVGAIRGSHTSKSTFKMISFGPESTLGQKCFKTHYTERY
jgi:hypothetical protein